MLPFDVLLQLRPRRSAQHAAALLELLLVALQRLVLLLQLARLLFLHRLDLLGATLPSTDPAADGLHVDVGVPSCRPGNGASTRAALPVPLVLGEVPLPEGPRASALPAPPAVGVVGEGAAGACAYADPAAITALNTTTESNTLITLDPFEYGTRLRRTARLPLPAVVNMKL